MAPLLAQKSGVDRAFERLYRLHARDVYRYAFAVLRNQADAEDVAQTTFMNAYRALERGESPAAPHNWLIAIAHNVCRQRFRAAARRPQEVNLDDDVADHFVQPENDDAPTPEDIKRALGHLAFNQRAALVMRELEGRSYAEIADLLEVSVSAVETLIFRARRALREQLEGTLTCGQAEQLLSRQLDQELAKVERGQLRAHLRECAGCRRLARSQRAQRSALRALGSIPLPQGLASLLGGTAPVAAKIAAVVVTAGVAGGVGYDVHHQLVAPPAKSKPHATHAAVVHRTSTPAVVRQHSIAAVLAPAERKHAANVKRASEQEPVVASPVAAAEPAPAPEPAGTVEVAPPQHGQEPAKEKPREHGVQPPADGTVPATDDTGAPPQPKQAPPGQAGKPDQPEARQPQTKPETPAQPENSGTQQPQVPVPAVSVPDVVGDLTQTSQKGGARNDAVGRLHP